MPVIQLSAPVCQTAVCLEGRAKTDYYDTAITGFILTVSAKGHKVYSLRYRDDHGRQRQVKIGDAKSITFDKARLQAQKLRSRVVLHENPALEREALRQVPTLSEFIAQVYVPHVRLHRRNFQSTLSFLSNHIEPRFGRKPLDAISPEMVSQAHQELRARGYALAMANKMPALFKTMYKLGQQQKIPGTQRNPADGVRLFELNNAKERFLTTEETQRLLQACEHAAQAHRAADAAVRVPQARAARCAMGGLRSGAAQLAHPHDQEWQGPQHSYFIAGPGDAGASSPMARVSLCGAQPGNPAALWQSVWKLEPGSHAGRSAGGAHARFASQLCQQSGQLGSVDLCGQQAAGAFPDQDHRPVQPLVRRHLAVRRRCRSPGHRWQFRPPPTPGGLKFHPRPSLDQSPAWVRCGRRVGRWGHPHQAKVRWP